MLKQILIVSLLFNSLMSFAQGGTTSPYSFYGIGIQKFKGTAETRSMAGISFFSDSIHLNIQNPSGVADLKLVNYSVGVSYKYAKQKSSIESQKSSTTSIDYIAIGIPMGKFGASFGLLPYSSVGYKLQSIEENTTTQSSGEGGLNRAFFSLAYKITPKFSFGIETNYNFGDIENTVYTKQEDLELGSREINRSELLGFSFNFGATYKTPVFEYLELTTSISFSPGTDFKSENSREIATIAVLPSGFLVASQKLEFDEGTSEFIFPSQLAIGVGIGEPKAWFVGAEYIYQKTSNFTNRFIDLDNALDDVKYVNASKFKIGGFIIPNYKSLRGYWKRIVYRAGFRYEETGINIVGQDINEFGISFGVGLPLGRLFSNINLGFEAGKRGTTNYGLIQENFLNTFISLSLNDKWFEKRYYD